LLPLPLNRASMRSPAAKVWLLRLAEGEAPAPPPPLLPLMEAGGVAVAPLPLPLLPPPRRAACAARRAKMRGSPAILR
jgi:hypothetical protein